MKIDRELTLPAFKRPRMGQVAVNTDEGWFNLVFGPDPDDGTYIAQAGTYAQPTETVRLTFTDEQAMSPQQGLALIAGATHPMTGQTNGGDLVDAFMDYFGFDGETVDNAAARMAADPNACPECGAPDPYSCRRKGEDCLDVRLRRGDA